MVLTNVTKASFDEDSKVRGQCTVAGSRQGPGRLQGARKAKKISRS